MEAQVRMCADTGRYVYMPLIDRPRIVWPGQARVAVWVAPNIEYYELDPPPALGHLPWTRPVPDVLNYAHRDYGNRVGVWRMIEVMERHGVRGSVSLSAALCDHLPEIVRAVDALGWEIFSHGIYNTRLVYDLSEARLRAVVKDSLDTISGVTGKPVRGWLAPHLSGADTLFDILPELGVSYTLDLLHDDQPTPLKVRSGRLISVPYSTELNDMPLLNIRGLSPAQYETTAIRQFDQLYEEGAATGMVMCLPLHPFLIGQPHRIGSLDRILAHIAGHSGVWFATAGEIADHYYATAYDEAARRLSEPALEE